MLQLPHALCYQYIASRYNAAVTLGSISGLSFVKQNTYFAFCRTFTTVGPRMNNKEGGPQVVSSLAYNIRDGVCMRLYAPNR